MQTYDITLLPAVRQNLRDIGKYLSQFYPSTKQKQLSKIHNKIDGLKEFPLKYPEREVDSTIFRMLPVDDYLVFYIVDEETATVKIHRIVNGKTDYLKVW